MSEFFAEGAEGCDGLLEGLGLGEEALCFGLVLVYLCLEKVDSILLFLDFFEEEGGLFGYLNIVISIPNNNPYKV